MTTTQQESAAPTPAQRLGQFLSDQAESAVDDALDDVYGDLAEAQEFITALTPARRTEGQTLLDAIRGKVQKVENAVDAARRSRA